MPKRALTAAGVKRLRPPAKGQVDHFDAALPGFALRVSAMGAKSYVLFYRPKTGPDAGKLRRMTIGGAAQWSLADAREEARAWKRAVDRGEDPKEVLAARHTEALGRAENTFRNVAEDFIQKHCRRRNKSWRNQEWLLQRYPVALWGDRPIETITRRDVIALLDDVVEAGKPILANRVFSVIRKLFNWCVERAIIETTPTAQMKAPAKETPRARELTEEEIRALWPALEDMGYPFGPLMMLLLITGQRRGEVAKMRWADLDIERGVWTLPSESTKAGRAHAVPLSPLAIGIIKGLPRFAGAFVFTSGAGVRPVSGFGRAKDRIDELSGVKDWRLHDLRRTAASGMARLGIAGDHIGRVLNHVPQGVTARVYDQYEYLPEKRRALETWGSFLDGLFRPDDDKVVALRHEGAA